LTASDKPPLNLVDDYVEHLAQLSEFVQIVTEEDIFNEFGVLLIPKGTLIKKSIADRLAGHKMEKPLDETVSVSNLLDQQQILADIESLISTFSDFQQIHKKLDYSNKLKHLTSVNSIPRLLRQKLSVLKKRLPDVYGRSLFTAWFGSMLAIEMQLEPSQIKHSYLVGLYHDLGLLHIPPALITSNKFNSQQWQMMESHVFISKQIVENAFLYADELTQAIAQHHERCDGTGYPRKLDGTSLNSVSQIIAMSDMFYNIRTREFVTAGKNMADFKSYLQVNTETYFYSTYKAAFAILTRSELTSANLVTKENFEAYAKGLLNRSQNFQSIKELSQQFLALIKDTKLGKHGTTLVAGIQNVTRTVERAGLIGKDINQWLNSINQADYESCVNELTEMEAIQQELLWLAKKSARLMPLFIRYELPDSIADDPQFKGLVSQIEALLGECWKDQAIKTNPEV
jgi:response regulator RpfG family c-di-GMP phosphodiesterase